MDAERILAAKSAVLYFVGIKGTGMAALAELLCASGFEVSGSDRDEVFYTDAILRELDIPCHEHFDPSHIPEKTDLVVYSAAYSPETNAELAESRRRGLPMLSYPEALGAYSALFDSSGIAGVHGKTTTTAMAGVLLRAAGIPAKALAGGAAFGGRSTLSLGGKYFVAETCEYRKHFLSFHPRRIVLTSVESDHQDYYPEYGDIRDAFVEYTEKLPGRGILVYCADDRGACEVAKIAGRRKDIRIIPYGFTAEGPWRVESCAVRNERTVFRLTCVPREFRLRVPGRHCVLDAAAALALTGLLAEEEFHESAETFWRGEPGKRAAAELENFSGSKRRSEILGEAGGILFMDDYGHHPTAIKTTLEGLKEFYPGRRLVVSFMSHTYSRTAALLDDFAASLAPADLVFLHKIYASARENNSGGVDGRTLFEAAKNIRGNVFYADEPEDAAGELETILKPGDLFITMGAGDNWKLGKILFSFFAEGRWPA
ncbi:MAG: UDP-N-acetylmuramate--L-alanine ligase [Treponema sp.]|jgi:UDP-N-acetylmuramate--alanine ligase|nr:UDP-N-acetylmuramate--L-alanine ligase [Treponema sp.]